MLASGGMIPTNAVVADLCRAFRRVAAEQGADVEDLRRFRSRASPREDTHVDAEPRRAARALRAVQRARRATSRARAGVLDFEGRAKFDAWEKKKDLARDAAQNAYVELVAKLEALYGKAWRICGQAFRRGPDALSPPRHQRHRTRARRWGTSRQERSSQSGNGKVPRAAFVASIAEFEGHR